MKRTSWCALLAAALGLAVAAGSFAAAAEQEETEVPLGDFDETEVEGASTVEELQEKLDEEMKSKELSSSHSNAVLEEWEDEDADEAQVEKKTSAEEASADKEDDEGTLQLIEDGEELAQDQTPGERPDEEKKSSVGEGGEDGHSEENASSVTPPEAETLDEDGIEINVSKLTGQGTGIPDIKEFVESTPTLKRLEEAKQEKKKKKPKEKPFLLYDREKEIFLSAQEKNKNRYQEGIENIEAELEAPRGPSRWTRLKTWLDDQFDKFAEKYGSSGN